MKILRLLLLNSLLLFAQQGAADESKIKIDGFVSVGYLSPSDNHNYGDKAGEGAILTENVLRLSYDFNNGFALSSQALLREAGDFYDGGSRLDFLRLDYRDSFWHDSQQTFTLGRFKTRQGFYNETRDVPSTRPSILLPQSVYFESNRNFVLSLDGLKISNLQAFDNGDLAFEFGVGKNTTDDKFNQVILGPNVTGDWTSDNNYYSDIRWETQKLSLAINYSKVSLSFTPNFGDFLLVEQNNISFPALLIQGDYKSNVKTYSAQYRLSEWEFTIEHGELTSESMVFSFRVQKEK